jgi:hypothetical protein
MDPMLSWIDTRVKFLLPLLIVLGIAVPAAAQGPGVRGGVSVDPDQVYFGGHYETEALIDRLHFRPNVELGLGDDLVTTALNMEFVYKFPTRSRWLLYAGGGPAVNFYSYDDDGQGEDNTNTEGGLNLLFGVENRGGLFFEVKVGAIDSPDVKFGVGFTFR